MSEQANYEVRTATNGFQAGIEADRFKPHVMLLDVHLGEADVRNIANMVRADDDLQMTKIIAMSGKMTDGQLQTLRTNGFDGYLKKPFQVRQVVETIESATALVA
jgi:DNA-binding response OmpR family regulator